MRHLRGTSEPLAEACGFTGNSFQSEYGGRLNKWDEAERATLRAELDAAFFHLYGISRDNAKCILSTFKGIPMHSHDQRAQELSSVAIGAAIGVHPIAERRNWESSDILNTGSSLVHYTDDKTAAHDEKSHQTADG